MSWQEELQQILSRLGVKQEYSEKEQHREVPTESTISVISASRSRPGVFYRMDLQENAPEVRIFIPIEDGPYKFQVYLVQLSNSSFLSGLFTTALAYQGGSIAFQEVEITMTYHLFMAVGQTMKQLFWKGDLILFRFPPEIEVRRLV